LGIRHRGKKERKKERKKGKTKEKKTKERKKERFLMSLRWGISLSTMRNRTISLIEKEEDWALPYNWATQIKSD